MHPVVVRCVVAFLLSGLPALAEVSAVGEVSRGVYWQKVEKKGGTMVVYFCRSVRQAKLQKAETCQKAGAKKP